MYSSTAEGRIIKRLRSLTRIAEFGRCTGDAKSKRKSVER